MYQNIQRYPFGLDVDYSFKNFPSGNHQAVCLEPLLNLKLSVWQCQFEGVSQKSFNEGVIFKIIKNKAICSNIECGDIIIRGCNISSEVVFFALLQMYFLTTKKWENWLEFAKKNLVCYELFLAVERDALIADIGYKFDFIPISGFSKGHNFSLQKNHNICGLLSLPPPADIWVDKSCFVVYWIVSTLSGGGLREKLNPLHELGILEVYFAALHLRGVKEKFGVWEC